MNHYEAKGIGAVLPGLELILDCISTEVNRMLELVNGEEENPANPNGGTALQIRTVNPVEFVGDPRKKRSMVASRTWKKKTAKQKRDWIAAINRGRRLKAKKKEAKVS